jgi:sterol desaturase/sphingolipid hydroxylase (fatty acid hydroxylase superfamily)
MEYLSGIGVDLWNASFGNKSRLWPLYLIATLVIAAALYRLRSERQPFLQWLMPKAVWLHPSHIVDLKVFALSRLLTVAGAFNVIALGTIVAPFVAAHLSLPQVAETTPHPFVIAALLLVVSDFATYWVHRLHHEVHILWPFHSLHHSAEVMTPVTVYRKHPIYDLTKSVIHGAMIGLTQGVLLAMFPGGVTMGMLLGVNAGYLLFNMLGANFRHTHIWLSYGRVMEHILISPAQHQIHHSIDPAHHNTNYGEVLAIWDWMFGTLYVPQTAEKLEFGLGDAQGNRLTQRHDSLTAALVVPIRDSLRQIRKKLRRKDAKPTVTPAE